MRDARCGVAIVVTMLLVLTAVPAFASTSGLPLHPLAASTARDIARELADEEMTQDPRLDTATIQYCDRAEGRIDCIFDATGTTKNKKFECHLRVAVRAERHGPIGEIVARSCRADLLPLLTYAKAYEAIALVAAARIPGFNPALVPLSRVSRSTFAGAVAFLPSTGGPVCARNLTAELNFPNSINIEIADETCIVFARSG